MTVNLNINNLQDFENLKNIIFKIADAEKELKENHHDVVVNVEVICN